MARLTRVLCMRVLAAMYCAVQPRSWPTVAITRHSGISRAKRSR